MKQLTVLALIWLIVILVFSCHYDDAESIKPDEKPDKPEPGDTMTYDPTPYNLKTPFRFPNMPVPADNPLTEEGIKLGRMLFYDPILSGDSTQSCGSCHAQEFAFSDHNKQFSTGIDGLEGDRTSMPIINLGWGGQFFWDGRVSSLEEQVPDPILNPIEMHLSSMEEGVVRIMRHDEYPRLFYEAFGTLDVKPTHIQKSISQFMRIMISSDSPFDRWMRGEENPSQEVIRGFEVFNAEIFEGGDCFHCHGTMLFTDHQFRNNALDSVFNDPGLGGFTGREQDMGRFKTPTLRNVAVSGPYMHDGRFETLEEVIEHYNSGGVESPTVDPFMKGTGRGGLNLTDQQQQDLIAFLHSLTDTTFLNNPKLSDPFE